MARNERDMIVSVGGRQCMPSNAIQTKRWEGHTVGMNPEFDSSFVVLGIHGSMAMTTRQIIRRDQGDLCNFVPSRVLGYWCRQQNKSYRI
jgi:hypothetical protein